MTTQVPVAPHGESDRGAGWQLSVATGLEPGPFAAVHGTNGVAPFVGSAGVRPVSLLSDRGVSGYAQVGRWRVTPGDVLGPPELRDDALSEYLEILADRRLRPVFWP